jgi:phosphate transport system substrate-binding protein
MQMRRFLAIALTAAFAAASVAVAGPALAKQSLPGAGATFPKVFIDACLADFNAQNNDFTVTYAGGGSGKGRGDFAKRTITWGMTDSPYAKTSDEPTFPWEYVPVIGGAINIPINLKNPATGRTLGSSIVLPQVTLAKIFGGQITAWNHPEIAKANPNFKLPATPIKVVYRSDSSGTSQNFLGYLNAWAPTIFTKVQGDFGTAFPGGTPPPSSIAGNGNAGVLTNVAANEGAIGYVDQGDAKGYPSARVVNTAGEAIAPSVAAAKKNLAFQTNVNAQGLVVLDFKLNKPGVYPLSIFSYGLVRTDGGGPNGLGVRQWMDYLLAKCGPTRAATLGYVPLGGEVLAKARENVLLIK